jgi:hypothetical protein
MAMNSFVRKLAKGVYIRDRIDTNLRSSSTTVTHLNTYPFGRDIIEYVPVDGRIVLDDGYCKVQPDDSPLSQVVSRWSYMVDIVGKNTRWLYFKPCYHEKMASSPELRAAGFPAYRIPVTEDMPNGGVAVANPAFAPCLLDALRAALPLPDPQTQDDLAALAERHFIDYIGSSDFIAFIGEIIEALTGNLIRLEKRFTKLTHKMQQAANLFYAKLLEEWKRSKSTSVFDHAISLNIAWHFAIKTTYKDIGNLFTSVEKAQRKLAHLRKVNHKDIDVKYCKLKAYEPPVYSDYQLDLGVWVAGVYAERPDDPKHPDLPHWWVVAAKKSGMHLLLELDRYECDYFACDMVRYDIPDHLLWDTIEAIGTMASALMGMYNPWGSVWELIPYSWVVDKFRSQRSILEQWKQTYCIVPTTLDPNDPNYLKGINPFPLAQMLGVGGHTWKIKSIWRVYARDYTMNTKDYLGRAAYDLYVRRPGLPTVETSGLQYLSRPFTDVWKSWMLSMVFLGQRTR